MTRVCLAMDMVMVMESLDIHQGNTHLHLVHIHHRVVHIRHRDTPRLVILLVLTLLQAILQQVILVAILLHIIQGMGAWGQCLLGVQQQQQLLMVPTTFLTVATMCLMVLPLDMVHIHMVASSSTTAESSNTMVASSSMVSTESLEESTECLRNGSKSSFCPTQYNTNYTVEEVSFNKSSYILL